MSREEELARTPPRKVDKKSWPPGVRTISMGETDALGVDDAGELYWHGKPIEIKRPLVLNWWQTFLATGTAVSAIVLAVIEVIRILKEFGLVSSY